MIRTLLPGLLLVLLSAGCTEDTASTRDMGNDTNTITDAENNTLDMGPDVPPDANVDMPAEDMPRARDSTFSNAMDVTAGGGLGERDDRRGW